MVSVIAKQHVTSREEEREQKPSEEQNVVRYIIGCLYLLTVLCVETWDRHSYGVLHFHGSAGILVAAEVQNPLESIILRGSAL
jgi:hypothetical protein